LALLTAQTLIEILTTKGLHGGRNVSSERGERFASSSISCGGGYFVMNEETPPRFIYDGLDPVPEPKSAITEVSEAVKSTVNRVSDAINASRKPGMPLSILSNIAREAPLGSLLVAFLLGVAVARRR
jgi:hypothetical protein